MSKYTKADLAVVDNAEALFKEQTKPKKTKKPLTIVIHKSIRKWPEWAALDEQGYRIVQAGDKYDRVEPDEADLWLGPNCWRMTEATRQYLDLAIQEAKKVKYATTDSAANALP